MYVKKATLTDLDELVSLFDRYRLFYKMPSDETSCRNFLQKRLERNESVIYIAFSENHEAIGFTQLYPLFSSTRMKRLWLLNDLYIKINGRGKGYGEALIQKAKSLCRESDSCGMMLETDIDNFAANNLYKKTDFALDKNHNYYTWDW